jgi:hypothetical protein
MNPRSTHVVTAWFAGLKTGDLEELVSLFAPDPRIKNGAQPLLVGPGAARRLLTDFFERTSARCFEVIDAAEGEGQIFAAWTAELTFRKGIQIADVVLPAELVVPLRGIERFELDSTGRIVALDIVHETTSVVVAARDLARASGGQS